MPTIFINGVPLFETHPKHLRDMTEAQDVEYEEIYEQSKDQDNENMETTMEWLESAVTQEQD